MHLILYSNVQQGKTTEWRPTSRRERSACKALESTTGPKKGGPSNATVNTRKDTEQAQLQGCAKGATLNVLKVHTRASTFSLALLLFTAD